MVLRQVELALRKYLPQGSYLLLAVSGGADSLALADACAKLAADGYLRAAVLHVEHGLRGTEGEADAALVAAFCAARALPCRIVKVDVQTLQRSEQHLSTEAAARRLRYQALAAEAERLGCAYIVTAHQADDQAETLLWRLLRGTGTAGLAGMAAVSGQILRPFLELRRSDLEEYCRLRQIAYATDSSNNDKRFLRNRLRLELLPLLRKDYNPEINRALASAAAALRADEDYLALAARQHYQELAVASEEKLCLKRDRLKELPSALLRRVLRQACFDMGVRELSYAQTCALEKLARSQADGKKLDLPGFLSVTVTKGQLFFYRDKGKRHGYQEK